ncbi:MAG: hypothetical protein IJV85_03045 [Clostridia bacterium]|nr:hypothetical protein [Clostridia bacterium]
MIGQYREPQAVELRYAKRKEWTLEGNPNARTASVVVDGYSLPYKSETYDST